MYWSFQFSLLLWIIYVSWDTLLQNIEILYYIWKYNKPLRKQIFIISFFLFFRIFPWNPFHHCEATLFAVLKIVKYFVRCLNIYVSFYKDKSELQYLCKVLMMRSVALHNIKRRLNILQAQMKTQTKPFCFLMTTFKWIMIHNSNSTW